jgi:hypothetical protein
MTGTNQPAGSPSESAGGASEPVIKAEFLGDGELVLTVRISLRSTGEGDAGRKRTRRSLSAAR